MVTGTKRVIVISALRIFRSMNNFIFMHRNLISNCRVYQANCSSSLIPQIVGCNGKKLILFTYLTLHLALFNRIYENEDVHVSGKEIYCA